MANFICYLFCYCYIVQAVYSLCVGTDCSAHVITSTGGPVTIQPQIDIQQSSGCIVNASAIAIDESSGSMLPVTEISTSAVTINLNNDDHPHEYFIDLAYSIATNEDCPSNRAIGVTLHQTIEVSIVGPPTIHHSTNSPHTLLCITATNVTATWIRFERDEDILGYCARSKQIFDGDYEIFYPQTSGHSGNTECVLQLGGTQAGVYACSVKYPTVDSLTTVKGVTIDKGIGITVIALSVVVGILCCVILIIVVVGGIVCWKRRNNNRYQELQPRPPPEERMNDDE